MPKHPLHVSHLVPFLPYLYFACLPVASFLSALNKDVSGSTFLLLLPTIPFLLQLFFSFKGVDLVLAIVTFVISLYLTLAYVWDLTKITSVTPRAISFITGGAIVVLLNFVMSIRLFRNFNLKVQQAPTL
ncbi:hypothetical protein [Paraflavitalea pollutisoli]|uniref:hypothetical protein n=1 Tax=Paraflavitalea pollutisoli TaxID=3034143 RepID=UPI0023EC6B98|nr:hypothetical protein [Paraflavitalea sp. H1-2-19X]